MFDESHERWPTPSAHLGTETLPTTLRERRPVAVGVDTHARSTVRKTRRHVSQEECPIRLSPGAEAHDSTDREPDRGRPAGGPPRDRSGRRCLLQARSRTLDNADAHSDIGARKRLATTVTCSLWRNLGKDARSDGKFRRIPRWERLFDCE